MTATPLEPTVGAPPGVPGSMIAPTGPVPAVGIPNTQDYPRLVFTAPYFETVAIADIIEPSVMEAVENVLPSLIPPYVDAAVLAGVQQYSVLLTGSTMTGPLFLSPLMPTQPSQAASMAYVDAMLATAGIPEVPPVPQGQVWGRETGQWVPISEAGGTFLPLSGGTMQGIINMSGNTITNMAAVPALPNGAAPAQWVLNQIASVSLYQGTWDADTNAPDLTQLSVRVNGYTWIAITTSVSGVVVSQPIPGLQGLTVFNGDTIIYSTVAGQFQAIHAGGLSLPEADARYVQLAGSQMSGALLLNADASQPLQAVTLEQLQTAVANTVTPDAPADGQAYLRVGVGTNRWVPGLPLAGGILTGPLTLSGTVAGALQAVPYSQVQGMISSAVSGLLPISGGTMTGPIVLSGNATTNLNPVSLGQLNALLGAYLPLTGGVVTGQTTFNLAYSATNPALRVVDSSGNGAIGVAGAALVASGTAFSIVQASTVGPLATITFSATQVNCSNNLAVGGAINANGDAIIFGSGPVITTGASILNINGPSSSNLSSIGLFATTVSCSANLNVTSNISATDITAAGNITAGLNLFSSGAFIGASAGNNTTIITNVGCQYAGSGIGGANSIGFILAGGNPFLYSDGVQVGWWALTASDSRLKRNVEAIERDCLAAVNAITLYQFDMETGDENYPHHHFDVGYIADQVREIMPDAVPDVPAGGPLGVDFRSLCAHLIGAVQQLSHDVDELKGARQ